MWRHRLALVGGSDSSPSESELEAELFDTPQRGPWEPTNHSPQPNGELSVRQGLPIRRRRPYSRGRDGVKLAHHAHLITQAFPRRPLHEIEQH
jgi:hypothetical protein